MATYAVSCTLQIPVENDEPREVAAVATFEDLSTDGVDHIAYGLDADGTSVTDMPTLYPVYLKSYVAIIPTPGPTQVEIDAELRLALAEHGWQIL